MTEIDTLFADPAEETQAASAETSAETAPMDDTSPAPLFCAPLLDRIRTSD